MKRGRKPTSDQLKIVRGTFEPRRRRGHVVQPLAERPAPAPAWLKAAARKLYAGKLHTYAARGQAVAGCEAMLAQYVALEAELIERYKKGLVASAALLTVYRQYGSEFFDTPSSQVGRGATAPAANPFRQHAERP